jgi:hypothetical protein
MSAAQQQLQRQENWGIDAIISLKNINVTARRISAEQKKQISTLRQEHPQLDCEILISNLSVLHQIAAEESRLLSLTTSAIPKNDVDDV